MGIQFDNFAKRIDTIDPNFFRTNYAEMANERAAEFDRHYACHVAQTMMLGLRNNLVNVIEADYDVITANSDEEKDRITKDLQSQPQHMPFDNFIIEIVNQPKEGNIPLLQCSRASWEDDLWYLGMHFDGDQTLALTDSTIRTDCHTRVYCIKNLDGASRYNAILLAAVAQNIKKKLTFVFKFKESGHIHRDDSQDSAFRVSMNFLATTVYQMSRIENFVCVRNHEAREQSIRNGKYGITSRTNERPVYKILPARTLVYANAEDGLIPEGEGSETKMKHKSPSPHFRRGFFKILKSEKWINARGKKVWVKSTWVGPEDVLHQGNRYRVLPNFGEDKFKKENGNADRKEVSEEADSATSAVQSTDGKEKAV